MKNVLLLVLIFTLILGACKETPKDQKSTDNQVTKAETAKQMSYVLSGQTPHDITSFTEGLFFENGKLFEGTGSPQELSQTRSIAGPVDIKTGKIDVKVELDRTKFFGEGVCILNGKLYQLTYKNQLAFIYDATTFKSLGTFKYANAEGWGLTTDGKALIMSDGTDKLTFINPDNYNKTKELSIKANGNPVYYLNELEYVNGYIFANIWTSTQIAKINATTGNVVGVLDMTALFNDAKSKNPNCAEMNGIAYNPSSGQLWVTGKMWPNIYQIQCEL
ncbi:MAG TPA: glutaminyl-peptide cyclotransferase [Saprospiraceae bacterium]|nr:glutaminyl-peptide cyclotransferase [Saprospiraceae bacterium]